jgi:type III restriction enzyme
LVNYSYQGTPHTYYPDYLVRLSNGVTLVLEVKGQDSQQNRTKREYLDEWVRAVNAHGGFGQWAWAVSMNPADLPETLERLVQTKNRSML